MVKKYTVDTFIEDYPCGFKDLEDNECEILCDGKGMTYREVTDLLNELTEKNSKQQDFIDQLQDEILFFKTANVDALQKLERKNQDLQERNNRQYEHLSQLYDLMKKQDWESLTRIIQELEEAEKQLQKEWGIYGDVE